MTTTHTDGTFPGAGGGSVWWQAWTPDAPQAVVVLVHGVHEHSGRYAHVAERLNAAGYAVYALDHAGHGRSSGARGDVVGMRHVVADVEHVRRLAVTDQPTVPLFLLGHSMGGLIALDHLVTVGQDGVAGLVLSAAAVDTSLASGLTRRVAPLIGRLAPRLGMVQIGAEKVSRDPAVVRDYEADPLNRNGKVLARTGAEMLVAVDRVVEGLPRISLPALVLHGTADEVVPLAGSVLIDERIGSADKTFTTYDGLFHEIFNEPEKEQVLDDVVAWLDAHRDAARAS